MSSATMPEPLQQEFVSRRILASFVCVDALTGQSVRRPLTVTTDGWTVAPNHSGAYVVYDGPGLTGLTTQFIPSGTFPATKTFEVTLQDPRRAYLPRRVNISAPQTVPTIPPAPTGSLINPAALAAQNDPNTVFCSQTVKVFPMPSAYTSPTWAVLRASVKSAGAEAAGVPGAVLRVVRTTDMALLAEGQTDSNGEALLAVLGPTTQPNTSGSGPVTLPYTGVTVTAYAAANSLLQPPDWISNPDDLLSNISNPALVSSHSDVQLTAGKELYLSFALAI